MSASLRSNPGPEAHAVFASLGGAWRRAWSLTERLSRFREIEDRTHIPFDRELAAEILGMWRASSPFDKGSYFADRLAIEGITEDEFTRLLGTSVEELSGNAALPEWVQSAGPGLLCAGPAVQRT